MELKNLVQKEEWITPRLVKFSDNNVESGAETGVYERVRIGGNVPSCNMSNTYDAPSITVAVTLSYGNTQNACHCNLIDTAMIDIGMDGTIANFNKSRRAFCS